MKVDSFDESKHPRDTDGKFTKKGKTLSNLTYIQKKKLLKALKFFAKKNEKKVTAKIEKTEIPPFPNENAVFFQTGKHEQTKHHKDHAIDLGCSNFEEYREKANEFWVKGTGDIYFSHTENKFYKYNTKTRLLLAIKPDGEISTFYKAKNKQVFENYKIAKRLKLCQK